MTESKNQGELILCEKIQAPSRPYLRKQSKKMDQCGDWLSN